MRIIFMGSPIFAVKSLKKLSQQHTVNCVYTQPPRPAGRGMRDKETAIYKYASENNIECFSPSSLTLQSEINKLKQINADIFIVVAYGLILSQAILDIPRYGCINGHASLLPRWRGAAPIQRAIEAGDTQTGVTAMQMELGLDTGPMLHQISTEIAPDETSQTLHDKLADLTAECLLQTLNLIKKNKLSPVIQPKQGACYAHKITKSETELDLRETAHNLDSKIRAFSPIPACWLTLTNGNRIKILEASFTDKQSDFPIGTAIISDDNTEFGIISAGKKVLLIRQLQPAGKKRMAGAAYLNGANIRNGDIIWESP